MTDSESPVVEFLCEETDQDRAVTPTVAAREYPELQADGTVTAEFIESARADLKTQDALVFGWYLYAPSDRPRDTTTIDTLWHVAVPDEYVLLVTNPLYDPEGPVTPQVFTSDDELPRVELPVSEQSSRTFDATTPIAQALPLSASLLNERDATVTQYTDEIEAQLDRFNALAQFYDDRYADHIHREKPDSGISFE